MDHHVCRFVTVDSSSEDESVSENVPASTSELSAIPTSTYSVTVSTCDIDTTVTSATAAVDMSPPVSVRQADTSPVPVSDTSAPLSVTSAPLSISHQPVADVAVVYQNVTSLTESDDVQQHQQQGRDEDELVQLDASDVDVLPTSRPQCKSLSLCFVSAQLKHISMVDPRTFSKYLFQS